MQEKNYSNATMVVCSIYILVYYPSFLQQTKHNIGMMDGAYFVGRKELLDFFNDLLDLNLAKIEQTCSGAVACQLTELIFPNSIPMARVNWEAKSDYEYVQNYKLLQAAFNKHHVQRHVDVDKLIRGKYQDNLEFCQWLKAFYDQAAGGRKNNDEEYNPRAVRARGKGGKRFNDGIPIKKGSVGNSSGSSLMTRGGGGGGATTTKRAPPPPAPQRTAVTTKTAKATTTSAKSRGCCGWYQS
jgi:microtubule-associated protein, RP/EB family